MFLSLLCLLVSTTTAAFTCASSNDATLCAALGDLYASTNGAGWLQKGNWAQAAAGTPTDYCSFFSVTCTGPFASQPSPYISHLSVHCECTTALLLAK